MNRIDLRSRCAAALALAAAASLLTACGGGGASSGAPRSLVIIGTWVNDADPTDRGRFVMTGTTAVSGPSGTLSGTLEFYDAAGVLVANEQVSGTLSESLGASPPYWSIDFATGDGKLTFFTASYDGYDSSSQLLGQFTNAKSGTATLGRWHSNPPGGFSDCGIDKSFAQTGYTFQDLAWSGSGLVAVATPTAGTAGIYEIDVSGASPVFALKTLTPTPANPTGIAWDGTAFWVASPSTATTWPDSAKFTLDAFTSTWADALAGSPVTGTGLSGTKPSSIAYWGGYLWYAPLLNFGSYQIERTTGAVTGVETLKLNRPNGLDSDGTSIWVASRPPGGVWGPLLKYDLTGNLAATVYAPEFGGADAVACEPGGFIWVASERNLYRLDVR